MKKENMEPDKSNLKASLLQKVGGIIGKVKGWLFQKSQVLVLKGKKIIENWEVFPPIVFGYLLFRWSDLDNKELNRVTTAIVQLSSFVSAIIIGFFSAYIIQIKRERLERLSKINNLTQILTNFRRIVNILVKSYDFWGDRHSTKMPLYIDRQYKDLSYFEYNEGRFVGSKGFSPEAKNFMDDNLIGGTKYLYLELKSFLPLHERPYPFWDETLLTEFEIPYLRYPVAYLEQLMRHECGHQLWYYFDHEFNIYEADFKFDEILKHDQETILNEVSKIDKERYKGMGFGPEMLAKLGTQIKESVIPTLFDLEKENERGFPAILNYLYVILTILIIIGVLSPITAIFLQAPPIVQPICSIIILSTALYLIMSYKKFLLREIKI